MSLVPDEALLDDPGRLAEADRTGLLRAYAEAGAQVRAAARAAAESPLSSLDLEQRPRGLVIAGMGGSGVAGDVVHAVLGDRCPVPVTTVRDAVLPGWVGAMDLVVAVSCSGRTVETLAVAEEAGRRGCRLLTVGAPGSPLEQVAARRRGCHVPVDAGDRPPRANLWALAVPPLVLAAAMGLGDLPTGVLEQTADRLDDVAGRCRPASESFVNRAKSLALDLAGAVPLVWGDGPLTGVAALRCAAQLGENAKYPAVSGVLPEAAHNQVVAFDGPWVGDADDTVFRDPVEEPGLPGRLRLVLLRDPRSERSGLADAVQALADRRGVPLTVVRAEGEHPLERLAGLVSVLDFASVYLALASGVDPGPTRSIVELKERIGP